MVNKKKCFVNNLKSKLVRKIKISTTRCNQLIKKRGPQFCMENDFLNLYIKIENPFQNRG